MSDQISNRSDYAVNHQKGNMDYDPNTTENGGITDDISVMPQIPGDERGANHAADRPMLSQSQSRMERTRRLSGSMPPMPGHHGGTLQGTAPPRLSPQEIAQAEAEEQYHGDDASPSKPPPLAPFGRPPSASAGRPPSANNHGGSRRGAAALGGSTRGDPFGGGGLRRGSQLNPNAGSMLRDVHSNSNRRTSLSTQMIRSDNSMRGGAPPQIVASAPSESKFGNFSSEDRQFLNKSAHADANNEEEGEEGPLFLPSLKREQFIPVRIAREKVKEVLAEMAVMRNKHMAAIETMEKQHQYLKNQLEGACAAYAKKLTNDYNVRVNALDAEYCRRLARLTPASAQQEVEERLTNARKNAADLERKTEERINAKNTEMENTRNALSSQLDRERALRDDLQEKLRLEEERARELDIRVVSLEKQVELLNDGKPINLHPGISTNSHSSPQKSSVLEDENARLREQVRALNNELDQVEYEDEDIHNQDENDRGMRSTELAVDDDDMLDATQAKVDVAGGGKTLDDGGVFGNGGGEGQSGYADGGGAFQDAAQDDNNM